MKNYFALLFALVSLSALGAERTDTAYPLVQEFVVRGTELGGARCGVARLTWTAEDKATLTVGPPERPLAPNFADCGWLKPVIATYELAASPKSHNQDTSLAYELKGPLDRELLALQEGARGQAKTISLQLKITDPRGIFEPITRKLKLYPKVPMRRFVAELTGTKCTSRGADSTGKTARLILEVPAGEAFGYNSWNSTGFIRLIQDGHEDDLLIARSETKKLRDQVLVDVHAVIPGPGPQMQLEDFFTKPAETGEVYVDVVARNEVFCGTGQWREAPAPR